MPSIPEDEQLENWLAELLSEYAARTSMTLVDGQTPLAALLPKLRELLRQYAAKARIAEIERKMTLHVEVLSSTSYKLGFKDALDQIDKANQERIKQLKEGV